MTELDEKISSLLPSIIMSIQESIGIPSLQGDPSPGAPFGREVKRALDHGLRTASFLGLRTKNVDGYVGWAEYGKGSNMIAVLGHLDVVPSGDGWTYPPFGAEIHNDKLYGRGALDDKGPAIGALWVLHAIKGLKIPLKHRIRVLLGTNEESGMKDIPYYLEKGEDVPVLGFTPDGDFPIVAYEKGQLHLRLERPITNSFGDYVLLSLSGGTVPNVVPSEAHASIGCAGEEEARKLKENLEFTAGAKGKKIIVELRETEVYLRVFGLAAHASTPYLGENAIKSLLELICHCIAEPWSEDLKYFFSFMEGTDGRKMGVAFEDIPSGKLTCNLGIIDFDGSKISLILDIRFPVTFQGKDILGPLRSFAKNNRSMLTILREKNPLCMPPESILIRKLQKVYREKTGLEPKLLSMGGGTYAKALPNTVAFGPRFPDGPDVVHKADEFIDIQEFLRVLQIMGQAMVEMAN